MQVEPTLEQIIRRCVPFEAQVGVVRAERGSVPEGEFESFPGSWSEKRAREHWAGRKAATRALERYSVPTHVGRADDGVPLFPEPIVGSIAHTGGRSVVGACIATPSVHAIGLDLEGRQSLAPELVERIIDDEENKHLAGFNLDRGVSGLWAFCAKEAYYKCVFPSHRRFLGFHDVSLRVTDPPGAVRMADTDQDPLPAVSVVACRLGEKALGDALSGRVIVTDDFVISIVWTA